MSKIRGFTLVEAVIAIGLFLVVAVASYGSFRSGLLAYGRIESQLGQSHELKMLVRQINEDLRSGIFYADIPFQGESDKIIFPARIRRFKENQFNEDLYQVTYQFRSRDLERLESKIQKKFNADQDVKEALLSFDSFRFQYAYRKQGGGIEWKNEWVKNPYGGIPKAIRILVKEKKVKEEKIFQFFIPHGILGTTR